MRGSTQIALVVSLAVLGTAIEARAECHYVRGSISETRILAPNDPIGRTLGTVTGVLNGAVSAVITSPPPSVRSLDIFVTKSGDMLTAIGMPMRTPVPGAPAGEFTVHVDLMITGGAGKYEAATGTMTFDGQSHNAFGGPGVSATDLTYQGTVCGPNIKGDGH